MNIGYKLVKNVMPATAEKAPYLGMAIPVGSLAYDNILKEMIKTGTKMTQPTAKYFLDALYEFAAEAIAAEVVRINIGTVSLYPAIDGSFDSEDAPFDPARNTLYVGASFAQELRDMVAGIAPDYAGGTSLGTVKLHSCMDLETQVFKVIRGTGDFRLAGANLTVPDGSDESLGLYAKNGVDKVADIVVSETDGGQRITCHLSDAEPVPVGTYKVRLASHGLDPTDPLTVATLTVTLVEAVTPPAPTITKVTSGSGDEPDVVYKAETVYVHGERFSATQDDTVTITKGDTDTWEWTGSQLTVVDPDGKLSLSYMSCKHNGETGTFFVGDDPCELTVSFKGSTRTVQYAGARV